MPRTPDPRDAIELEVFRHLLASIADEMGVRLMRSAFSPNIKERRDFSCALFDADGETLAQAAHIPVHLGSAALSVQAVMRAFPPETMSPEDRFVVNDPFAGGTHLPDITLVAPFYAEGEERPRFYVANRAHHADVGGRSAGSMPLSRSIDEEGVRIPPRRLDEETVEWICGQTRTPAERRGDLQAQLAAIRTGLGRLEALCRRHGADTVARRGRDLQDYTARLVGRAIGEIPDGEYAFEDVLDDDGLGREDIVLRCRLRVEGERAVVDLRDCDDQVSGPLNAVRAIAVAATAYVFRCLAPSDLAANGGVLRPVELLTRPGSVVDALPPAAVAGGNVETSQRIVDVLFGALAQALPDRIPAASCGSMNNLALGGTDSRRGGRPFAYYETIAGGAGAGPSGDGASAVHTHMTNTRNTPVEALEHAYPLRVEAYRIREGSGGPGRHRGGEGGVRRYAFNAEADVTLLAERRRHSPWGANGGGSGQTGVHTLIEPDDTRRALPGKCTLTLTPGQSIEIATPGGGGWGEG